MNFILKNKLLLKKWFYTTVVKFISKYFKLWGVKIETPGLSEEFIITHHAYKRLLDRVGVSEEKIKKLAIKAWYSTNKVDKAMINRKEYKNKKYANTHYRSLMGQIYIWKVRVVDGSSQKILITVY